ncbi:MAG: IMP cyclohydrolase [Lentisphaeraceae bacterium]|nr:IMP cyclohydrolase [Lentisphaeraceae bacterium]
MYVGRIVSIGRTNDGKLCAMYRVSSRSFPNRMATKNERGIAIVPKKGHENDVFVNPYIAYNCLRLTGSYAVATNGSHTDPITEKLEAGMNMRDALVNVLHGMDYEHDHLNTPRIASIVDSKTGKAALGIVKIDGLYVREFDLKPGEAFYIATYEHDFPCGQFHDKEFDVVSADAACDYILGKGVFADLERPVSAACAVQTEDGFEVVFKDAEVK